METKLESLEQARRTLVDLAVKFGPRVVAAILILIAGFLVARWVGRMLQRWLHGVELEPPIRMLFLRGARVLVLGLFLIIALQNLGVELLPLIAGIGVAGAGVALAMQGVLGNLSAGLTIIFTKPFRVGEYVALVGVEGRVETIELFSTVLSHPDQSRVVIPNRKIVGEILHNYGKVRQLNVEVGVAYDTDLNVALAAVNAVLRGNSRVLKEPAPIVGVKTLADSSVQIAVKPWVTVPDYVPATAEINKALVEEFRSRDIAIPFPQREIRILSATA
ncbi:MAG TPA: mechanosensitive ion channel family protein [Opitutaceae bacterium]|nr:mechanosensitive ion channel family protein [Opitutaceae bacterium]